jgi:hypothetical protein
MASLNIDLTSPRPSSRSTRSTSTATTSQSSSLPNAFGRLIDKGKGRDPGDPVLRDTCLRPTLEYNTNYNPYAIPSEDLPDGYNPYAFKEPLFDDRLISITQLLKNCTVAPPAKKGRRSWVWHLGYAITNSSRPSKPILMWHCKLCKYWDYYTFITNLK